MKNNKKVYIEDLIDIETYNNLIYKISSSKVSSEEKEFLFLAATRYIVFHYSKIAKYYANVTPEMQELMEDLELIK